MSTSPAEGNVLENPAPTFTASEAERIASAQFGLAGVARALASERDQNFRIESTAGRFVLKIANSAEDAAVLDFQMKALQHVAARDASLPVPRVHPAVDGSHTVTVQRDGERHQVRLLSFLEGITLGEVAPSPARRRSLGRTVARLDRALRGYFHPAAGHELLWDLEHATRLRQYLPLVAQPERRRLAVTVFDRFANEIQPRLGGLRGQVIHNDCNRDNVLVAGPDSDQITGVIDFGDMVFGTLAGDLAVAAAYQLIEQPDALTAMCDVAGAYHAEHPLEPEELAILPDLIATRLAMSAVICTWRGREHPDNIDYILGENDLVWEALGHFATIDRREAQERLAACCGLPAEGSPQPLDVAKLRQRRARRLGKALSLFYEEPLHLVRGRGVWLFDAQGRAYLDAYNNVAHVGHCHPAVTAALARQACTLNTNTRYLHASIVDYAERLAALLPGDLGVCMFVCTGSEANDLALQIARSYTGNEAALVTEYAYHGNTVAVAQLSPEELPRSRRADWIETVPAPDTYRGDPRSIDAAGAIDRLAARGYRPAALFIDTAFTSDGIFLPPAEYVATASGAVRAAGGLYVADEVQAGFGRTGDDRWGFERYGVVPDIVTLGKPMGNGHPLAAVVTTPVIAKVFGRDRSYFNTFGGNPVSCAAGLAVLEVIEREALQTNAARVGAHLRAGLGAVTGQHSLIGDVRGSGLFFGVELVRDRASKQPATDLARTVMNEMKRRGVLVGSTGPRGNVLKIRPPLVFERSHADRLVEVLDEVLGEVERQFLNG